MNIIDWILYIPLVFCVCYLLLYAIASKFYRAPHYPEAHTLRRFVVLFPAYKEDRVILSSVRSFLEQDYPKELFEIIYCSMLRGCNYCTKLYYIFFICFSTTSC